MLWNHKCEKGWCKLPGGSKDNSDNVEKPSELWEEGRKVTLVLLYPFQELPDTTCLLSVASVRWCDLEATACDWRGIPVVCSAFLGRRILLAHTSYCHKICRRAVPTWLTLLSSGMGRNFGPTLCESGDNVTLLDWHPRQTSSGERRREFFHS